MVLTLREKVHGDGVFSTNDILINLATLLSFPSLMVLKPIEYIFALNLTIKTELVRDLLNLISAWGAESRTEELSQKLSLFSCGIPTPTLGASGTTSITTNIFTSKTKI